MRKVVAAAGLVALLAVAAAPPADRLDAVLKRWDAARRGARQSHYKFTRTATYDDAFKGKRTKTVWQGDVFIQRPDRLRVEARDEKGDPAVVALFVGGKGRTFLFDARQEVVLSLPEKVRFPAAAERCIDVGDRGFMVAFLESQLWAVLGPPSGGLEGRFTPRLEKEDGHWSYLRLEPKRRWGWLPDQGWLVALDKRDGWLRRVWCGDDLGQGTVVDFKKPDHEPQPASTWEPPFKELPKGWTRAEVPPRLPE
jgi:hypothetical protein